MKPLPGEYCLRCQTRHAPGHHAPPCWCNARHFRNQRHHGSPDEWPSDWRERVPVEEWHLYGVEPPAPEKPIQLTGETQ